MMLKRKARSSDAIYMGHTTAYYVQRLKSETKFICYALSDLWYLLNATVNCRSRRQQSLTERHRKGGESPLQADGSDTVGRARATAKVGTAKLIAFHSLLLGGFRMGCRLPTCCGFSRNAGGTEGTPLVKGPERHRFSCSGVERFYAIP